MNHTTRVFPVIAFSLLAGLTSLSGCSSSTDETPNTTEVPGTSSVSAKIGVSGGTLQGPAGTPLAGVRLEIPKGALSADTVVAISLADATTPLPKTALQCGSTYRVEPLGMHLATPASLTMPFDPSIIAQQDRDPEDVRSWVLSGTTWTRTLQTGSEVNSVTIPVSTFAVVAPGVNPPSPGDVFRFKLHPNPKFIPCLAQYPDDPDRQPTANVKVIKGDVNDRMTVSISYIKPGLAFDVFTVQHSSLQADGTVDPNFKNFGLAWYQSDLEAEDDGTGAATIRTILLNQIFGFDPEVSLAPTNTFHVGFWFNNPNDAVACGFDATKPTPFNGEHKAGPLAMISVPDSATTLGPLCTNPDNSTSPPGCNP